MCKAERNDVVTILYTNSVYIECPQCGAKQDGFVGNPTGGEFECDECKTNYKIHSDADVEFI